MMFRIFEGESADAVWRSAASALMGGVAEQASRVGPTREILRAAIAVEDPRQRWVLSRRPAINPAFAIVEVIWILNGRNDARFLTFFNRELSRFAGAGDTYHGAYGHRLRVHRGVDQLARAYEALRGKPQSRQVVLQIWDSPCDLPGVGGQEASADVPCNVAAMLKVRKGRLEWTQVLRSNDVHRGLPYNMIQFTSLQEIVAGWLGLQLGSYCQLSDSLHLYESDCPELKIEQESDCLRNDDDLSLDRTTSEAVFREMAGRVEAMIGSAAGEDIEELSILPTAPSAYKNLMSIVGAEVARRRKLGGLAEALAARCTNPMLRKAWTNWMERTSMHRGARGLPSLSG